MARLLDSVMKISDIFAHEYADHHHRDRDRDLVSRAVTSNVRFAGPTALLASGRRVF